MHFTILSTPLAQSWATVYPKMHYSNLAARVSEDALT
jgi:hypothetical protein